MTTTHLPLDTWMVVEEHSAWTQLDLLSRHSTQAAAEAGRDRKIVLVSVAVQCESDGVSL